MLSEMMITLKIIRYLSHLNISFSHFMISEVQSNHSVISSGSTVDSGGGGIQTNNQSHQTIKTHKKNNISSNADNNVNFASNSVINNSYNTQTTNSAEYHGETDNTTNPVLGINRKPSSSDSILLMQPDEDDADENKYKRRSAMDWFSRWWRYNFILLLYF